MSEPLFTYLDSLIDQVLESPGYKELPEDERGEIKTKLGNHFQNLISDTLINRLSDEQVSELEKITKEDPDKVEETVEKMSATIPGLATDIEVRLNQEVDNLKRLGQK